MKKKMSIVLVVTMVLFGCLCLPTTLAEDALKSVKINEKNVSILAGGPAEIGSIQLTLTFNPENPANKNGMWSSANENVAVVDQNGFVTAVAAGNTNILFTAEDGNGKIKAKVSVKVGQAVSEVTILNENGDLSIKKTLTLKTSVLPKNAANKKLKWTSSDENVATVNANGQVKGLSIGTAIIKAEAADGSGAEAIYEVHVVQPVTKVTAVDKKVELAIGTEWKQTIGIEPENATNKNVTWKSSKETVATVSDDGIIHGVGVGKCTITGEATDGSKKTVKVEVTVKDYDVVFTSNEDQKVDFTTVNTMEGAVIRIGSRVIGDYTNTDVVIKNGCVESNSGGTLTPLKAGSDTITVTVKKNNRSVISKKTYTVYVSQSAMEAKQIETGESIQE